jgi:hypothetical protein
MGKARRLQVLSALVAELCTKTRCQCGRERVEADDRIEIAHPLRVEVQMRIGPDAARLR